MIEQSVLISLFCFGLWNFIDDWIYHVSDERVLNNKKPFLYQLASWLATHNDKRWAKPLWACHVCMPSVWGTLISLLIFVNSVGETAIIVAASSGINYLAYQNLKT